MIERTDEMIAAFAAAKATVKGCPGLDDGDEQGLAAVLAIVERNYTIRPRRQGDAMTAWDWTPKRRIRACVEAWPEAETGAYDPRCCRFPKSCSATAYDEEQVADEYLEPGGTS